MTVPVKPTTFAGAALTALLALSAPAAGNVLAENSQSPAGAPAQVQPAPQQSPPPAAPPMAAPVVPPQPPAAANRPGFLYQLKVWWDDSAAFFDPNSKDAHGKADDPSKHTDGAGKGTADAARDGTKGAATTPPDTMKSAVEAPKGAATATQDAMKSAVEATKSAATTAADAMKGAMEATKNAATAIVRLPNTRVVDLHETCAKAPNGGSDCAAAAVNGCRGKGFSTGNPLDVRTAENCDAKPLQGGNISRPIACATETVVIRAVCQ
jgi:hypothetical protein